MKRERQTEQEREVKCIPRNRQEECERAVGLGTLVMGYVHWRRELYIFKTQPQVILYPWCLNRKENKGDIIKMFALNNNKIQNFLTINKINLIS